MENQMQTTGTKALSTPVNTMAGEVMRSDIIVPYVVLAQGQSESVQERKAQLGDIIRSTNFEKLGDPDKPIDVVFLHYPKTQWIIENKPVGAQRYQYVRTEPRNATNETDTWNFFADLEGHTFDPKDKSKEPKLYQEGDKNVIPWRRVKQFLVFGILPKDMEEFEKEMAKAEKGEMPDITKALTPVLFSFRSTSYKAGKEICTFFTKAAAMKVPAWKYSVPLVDYLEKNDDGSFYVWKTDQNKIKPVKKEFLPIIENWVDIVMGGQLKAHDEGEAQTYANPQEKTVDKARAEKVL